MGKFRFSCHSKYGYFLVTYGIIYDDTLRRAEGFKDITIFGMDLSVNGFSVMVCDSTANMDQKKHQTGKNEYEIVWIMSYRNVYTKEEKKKN